MFVVGDESCSLDAAVSAIVLSMYFNFVKPKEGPPGSMYIPVLNTWKTNLALKVELAHVLGENIMRDVLTM